MKRHKYVKIFFLFLFFCTVFPSLSRASEIIRREEIDIDESLSEQIDMYSSPKAIYISQFDGFNSKLNDNPKEWIKLLYYYSITRLNLNDIPYNYLIDPSGNIYEGAKGGIGINPGIENGENIILVGIMDSSSTLSPRASNTLKIFVEDMSAKYGISEGNWELVDLQIRKGEDSLSTLKWVKSNRLIYNSISFALKDVKWSEKVGLQYSASIASVEYGKEVVIGKRLDVVVKIKNENDFTWFGDLDYIYLSTKDSAPSPHAINETWESFSKPTYIKEKFIKAGDSAQISFQLDAKRKPGKYRETFYFMLSPEVGLDNSSFDVEFSIVKGDNKLVEVSSPQYGYVNIRDCRWYSCKVAEVANEGDVFITTSRVDGWYEIIYGENKKGWIVQRFAKEI